MRNQEVIDFETKVIVEKWKELKELIYKQGYAEGLEFGRKKKGA